MLVHIDAVDLARGNVWRNPRKVGTPVATHFQNSADREFGKKLSPERTPLSASFAISLEIGVSELATPQILEPFNFGLIRLGHAALDRDFNFACP